MNDRERALDELQIAYETRKYNMMYLAVDPVYDGIRNHPRYRSLLAAMGLATTGGDEQTVSH